MSTSTITETGITLRGRMDLPSMMTELQRRQARQVNLVLPATSLAAEHGLVRVSGVTPVVTEHGVTTVDGLYQPTRVFLGDVAAKFDIPAKYLHRLRGERVDLFDANVNGLIRGRKQRVRTRSVNGEVTTEEVLSAIDPDQRRFTVRLYTPDGDERGTIRTLLSDRYRVTHYLDNAMAVLAGMQEAGLTGDDVVVSGEISETRMYLRIEAPVITAAAPTFTRGYRSPFSGQSGEEMPLIHAFLSVTDSEVGHGQLTVKGGAIAKVCSNGMTADIGGFQMRHVGGRMEEGVIDFREDTHRANADLIAKQVRDAVSAYLSAQFIEEFAATLEEKAGKPVEGLAGAEKAVEVVGQRLRYTKEQQQGILDYFVRGGQFTAAGVANAITAYAQVVQDPDEAFRLEDTALSAMSLV